MTSDIRHLKSLRRRYGLLFAMAILAAVLGDHCTMTIVLLFNAICWSVVVIFLSAEIREGSAKINQSDMEVPMKT